MSSKNPAGKGNPASKRMGNPKLKERRAESWRRGQERKKARVSDKKKRETVNAGLREKNLSTAWDERKAARFARRHPE